MNRFRSVLVLMAFLLITAAQFSLVSAQTKITIGYAAVSPRTTPLYLAQEQGLFAKYGLDPKIVLVRAAATLVATLVSGEMDVGYTGGTSVLGAAGQGSYLKILSSISSTLTHTWSRIRASSAPRSCAANASAFKIPAAPPGSIRSWPWNMSV